MDSEDKEIESIHSQMLADLEGMRRTTGIINYEYSFTERHMRLLVLLSKKSEKQTKIIKNLTYFLVFLTVTLIGIAIYQDRKSDIKAAQQKREYYAKMDSLINAVKAIPMKQNHSEKETNQKK